MLGDLAVSPQSIKRAYKNIGKDFKQRNIDDKSIVDVFDKAMKYRAARGKCLVVELACVFSTERISTGTGGRGHCPPLWML